MHPEHQERIFERFYRVDKSHSKAVGGTGLGLSIVKHAAKIHNAKVDVKSHVWKRHDGYWKRVIDAYAELYEETDDDIVVLDGEIRFYQITAL